MFEITSGDISLLNDMSDAYNSLADFGLVPAKDGYLRAKDAALKALELDDNLAEAHSALALIKSSYDWDWSGADSEVRRAIELNPSYLDAHRLHAVVLWQTGRLHLYRRPGRNTTHSLSIHLLIRRAHS